MQFNRPIYILILSSYLFLFIQCNNGERERKPEFHDAPGFYPLAATDSLEKSYYIILDSLWKNNVPPSGQAATVQGELVRIIEKLDHEIRGNGKGNWEDPQFKMLTSYLKDTLTKTGVFPENIRKEIASDIDILADDETAVTEEYYYDRLRRRIVEWCKRYPYPIKNTIRPDLNR